MLDFFVVLDDGCFGVAVPDELFNLTSLVIKCIQIVVPILLIIWGMLDFAKGVIKSDEKEIKAGQKTFISRLIIAAMVFLVVTVVRLVVSVVDGIVSDTPATVANNDTFVKCMDKFINGDE